MKIHMIQDGVWGLWKYPSRIGLSEGRGQRAEGLLAEGGRLSHLSNNSQVFPMVRMVSMSILGINKSMAAMLRSMLYPFGFPLPRT